MKQPLGQLERVNLHEAWKYEASEFTPWLAQPENLSRLADALGLLELELVRTEHPVDEFKLDILCKDDEGFVIIENQLEKSDHTHLGQILLYAAGAEAKKVIWVAESFRPAHAAALAFLNRNTTGDLNFFAVEIELWRIGESPMAPSFNVVVRPSDWSKSGRETVRAAAAATPVTERQLRFWTSFVAHLDANNPNLKHQKPNAQHWLTFTLGRTGFQIRATVNSREARLGVELYINHKNSKVCYHQLLARRGDLEQQLGIEGSRLTWLELPKGHDCRIVAFCPNSDIEDESKWPTYFIWLTDNVTNFSKVFREAVRDLPQDKAGGFTT